MTKEVRMLDKKEVQDMLLQLAADTKATATTRRNEGNDAAAHALEQRAEVLLEDAKLCDQK